MIRSFEEETEYTVGEQCLYLILGCNTTTIYTTEYLSKEVSVLCMESLNGNPDMQEIKGDSPAAVFFRETLPEEFNGDYYENGWERVIWDIAAPGAVAVPEGYSFSVIPAPVFGDNWQYAFDRTRRKIIFMEKVDRDTVIHDAFACLSSL